jgi:hypothetical protein
LFGLIVLVPLVVDSFFFVGIAKQYLTEIITRIEQWDRLLGLHSFCCRQNHGDCVLAWPPRIGAGAEVV